MKIIVSKLYTFIVYLNVIGKGVKTPSGGDRFIPARSACNFELGHFKVFSYIIVNLNWIKIHIELSMIKLNNISI